MRLLLDSNAARRIAILVVVLFGFAARIYAFDTTYIDSDRANVHGVGLEVLDKLQAGKIREVPLLADPASVKLYNGPLAAYLLAFVALFDRSLTTAVLFGLMLNALVMPLAFFIGRRLGGWRVGLLSAAFIALSNWAVFMARGTWHPAYNEIGSVLAVALFVKGILDQRGRYIVGGFLVCALTAGAGMEGFALPVQAAAATAIAGLWRGKLRRVWLTGIAICIGAGLIYVLALAISGHANMLAENGLIDSPNQLSTAQRLARDVTAFNQDPIGHFLRLVSNADYGWIWTSPFARGYAIKEALGRAQALLLSALVVVGLCLWMARWRLPVNRFLLVWGLGLVLLLAMVLWRDHDFRMPPYYLLSVSPIPHLAAACGLIALLDRIPVVQKRAWPVALCSGMLAIVPAWNFYAAAQTVYNQKMSFVGFMPLRWTKQLGEQWRAECTRITGAHEWWDVSVMQSSLRIARGRAHNNDFSAIRSGPPEGGDCIYIAGGRPLPNTERLYLPLDDGSVIQTYRATPFRYTGQSTLTVNLGWSLLDYSVRADSPTTLTVRHVWRIDSLPSEPHLDWYFAPFAKLLAPDGHVVAQFDNAVSMAGWEWTPGSIIISEADMAVPPNLAAGDYVVQASLFDPNQKKSAVYFDVGHPGQPILTLDRIVRLPVRR